MAMTMTTMDRFLVMTSYYFLTLCVFNQFFGFASCSHRDHIVSDTVHDVLKSVQGIVSNLQDYVGDSKKGCTFTCPAGFKPKRNYNHRPSSNGCGAFGIQFDSEVSIKSVSKCCDEHDICYDTCNKRKVDCDKAFKSCLESVCLKAQKISKGLYKGCKSTVDIMYAGTVALGCKPYKDAQQNACVCDKQKYEL